MKASRKVQGRTVTERDIKTIQSIIAANPNWHRTCISQELCNLWNWKNDTGKLKAIAVSHYFESWTKRTLLIFQHLILIERDDSSQIMKPIYRQEIPIF